MWSIFDVGMAETIMKLGGELVFHTIGFIGCKQRMIQSNIDRCVSVQSRNILWDGTLLCAFLSLKISFSICVRIQPFQRKLAKCVCFCHYVQGFLLFTTTSLIVLSVDKQPFSVVAVIVPFGKKGREGNEAKEIS